MRSLPHSRGGTWLLAGAVWAATCGVAWCVLPPMPRSSQRLQQGARLFGIGDGGTMLLAQQPSKPEESHWYPANLEVLDTRSGRVAPLLSHCMLIATLSRTPDGRIRLLIVRDAEGWRLVCIDLSSCTLKRCDPPCDPMYFRRRAETFAISADGHLFAYQDLASDEGIVVWDIAGNRRFGLIPRAIGPIVFSADNRSLTAVVRGSREEKDVVTFDLPTLTSRRTLRFPANSGYKVHRLCVNPEATTVVAHCRWGRRDSKGGVFEVGRSEFGPSTFGRSGVGRLGALDSGGFSLNDERPDRLVA